MVRGRNTQKSRTESGERHTVIDATAKELKERSLERRLPSYVDRVPDGEMLHLSRDRVSEGVLRRQSAASGEKGERYEPGNSERHFEIRI